MGQCRDCRSKERDQLFRSICPALYQSSDFEKLPQPQLAEAMAWRYGPKGLILVGDTGKGKSRVAWLILKRIITSGGRMPTISCFDAVGFSHELTKRYRSENAEQWLDKVTFNDIVFFDDLGKLKLTERVETELFGVIERRCAAQLPIIATTNDTGDSLAARMTDNRGPAMIRRLREFCQPIQF